MRLFHHFLSLQTFSAGTASYVYNVDPVFWHKGYSLLEYDGMTVQMMHEEVLLKELSLLEVKIRYFRQSKIRK